MSGLNEAEDRHYEMMGDDHRIIMVKLDWRLDWWLACCLTDMIVIIDGMNYKSSLELCRAHARIIELPAWAPELNRVWDEILHGR